jgi:anti-sigma factor RsiW
MKQMPTFRDAEKISAYLDGQLPRAEMQRLAVRLQSDPQLAAVAEALRQARALLRQTPRRRAPRNFMLTPEMAGIKPPIPRPVPLMRFAAALAAFLLFVTLAVNTVGPLAAVSAPMAYGGMGGGSADEALAEPSLQMEAVPAEPLPEQRLAATAEAAPTQAAAFAPEMPAQPKAAAVEPEGEPTPEPQQAQRPPIPTLWPIGLAAVTILLAAGAFVLVYLNDVRWRRRITRR